MAEEEILKLEKNIAKFLEVYNVLSAEGRASFEAQMMHTLASSDEKTRKLYMALLKSAKEGLSIEKTIEEMEKVSK